MRISTGYRRSMPPKEKVKKKVKSLMKSGCSFDSAFSQAINEIDDKAKKALDVMNLKHKIRLELERNRR